MNQDQIRLLLAEGRRDDARAALAAAVKDDPKDAQAWYGLAQLLEDPDKKKYCLEKARQLRPNVKAISDQLRALETPAPPAIKPAQTTTQTILILCLVAIGLVWAAVGVIEIASGLSPDGDSSMALYGLINLCAVLVIVWLIALVGQHSRRVVGSVTWIAALGLMLSCFGLFNVETWIELIGIPFYLVALIMVQTNKGEFTA
jgi:tetratricopeptide (TPR) repeat protein